MLMIVLFALPEAGVARQNILDHINETNYESNLVGIKNLIIDIEKIRNQKPDFFLANTNPTLTMLVLLILIAILGGLVFLFQAFLRKYYYPFHFMWGDYEEYYNKKNSHKKLIISLFFALVIGVLGSYFAGLIPKAL